MRDGVSLVADVFIPLDSGQPLAEKLPAVLQRTPYDRTVANSQRLAALFASHGYLSVIQDCRGRFASEGEFSFLVQEPNDGYDTIVWLAAHPACNGKVGMFGSSYRTWVQFQAASRSSPMRARPTPIGTVCIPAAPGILVCCNGSSIRRPRASRRSAIRASGKS
jgi:putative CocE/NonD family hydrolase